MTEESVDWPDGARRASGTARSARSAFGAERARGAAPAPRRPVPRASGAGLPAAPSPRVRLQAGGGAVGVDVIPRPRFARARRQRGREGEGACRSGPRPRLQAVGHQDPPGRPRSRLPGALHARRKAARRLPAGRPPDRGPALVVMAGAASGADPPRHRGQGRHPDNPSRAPKSSRPAATSAPPRPGRAPRLQAPRRSAASQATTRRAPGTNSPLPLAAAAIWRWQVLTRHAPP